VFRVHASDPDDSVLTYAMQGPAWLHIDSSGTVQGVPSDVGEFPVMVRVSDPAGASDTLAYVLSVTVLKSVADLPTGIPTDYVLQQNFPNPFNPSTRIRFGLPERSNVRMTVYNLVGQRVEEFAYADMDAGYHEVVWQPSQIASGAYIIVLDGKGVVTNGREMRLVRKAVLLR
jgi:hypothetical protein